MSTYRPTHRAPRRPARRARVAAAILAAGSIAAAALLAVTPATMTASQQAQAATTTANGYASHLGGNYACTALGMVERPEAHAWLVEHRGFTPADADALLDLAAERGCAR